MAEGRLQIANCRFDTPICNLQFAICHSLIIFAKNQNSWKYKSLPENIGSFVFYGWRSRSFYWYSTASGSGWLCPAYSPISPRRWILCNLPFTDKYKKAPFRCFFAFGFWPLAFSILLPAIGIHSPLTIHYSLLPHPPYRAQGMCSFACVGADDPHIVDRVYPYPAGSMDDAVRAQ